MFYCQLCERNIDPKKAPWSWLWFLVWLPTAGIVYVIYHIFLKRKTRCPICGTNKIEKVKKEKTTSA